MTKLEPESFRPRFGIGLTIVIGLIAAATAIVILVGDGLEAAFESWPWLALLGGGCWAVFFNPKVEVNDSGVRLVNVWHTVDVAWDALVGLDTKWALTLVTAQKRFRAWAAPAPGRQAMRSEHPNTHRLSEAAIGGEVRPGDLPTTDSGEAAAMVRKHWRVYLESLPTVDDDDAFEPAGGRAQLSVHWAHISVAAGLVGLAIAGLA